MDPKIVVLIVYMATLTSGADHHPRVHEDQVENESGSVRNARNLNTKQKIDAYQPQSFNYRSAKQQDQLKHRYAQQQKVDFKGAFYMRGPSAAQYPQGNSLSNPQPIQSGLSDDWQPFEPRVSKQIIERNPKINIVSTKQSKSDISGKSARKIESNSGIRGRILKDLEEANSDTVIKTQKIDRQDGPHSSYDANIVYIHPRNLKQIIGKNANNQNSIGGIPEIKFNALSDLVGKNPNVQLEGLKHILMQEVSQNNLAFPTIKGPQPFKPKDHTPIVEKSIDIPNPKTRPNVQVNHEQASPSIIASILQQSPAISQNSLESLQKQLDAASNIEAQKVLEKANKDAQAHVEAQHKAIEDAQKAILQKFHLDRSPQALPLIQQQVTSLTQQSDYQNAQPAEELNSRSFYPTPLPELQTASSKIPINNNGALHETSDSVTYNNVLHQAVPIQSVTKSFPISTKRKPSHHYPSKNVEFYAPNHHHQAAIQLQAEKALIAQVETQNSAILNTYKKLPIVENVPQDESKVVDTFQKIIFDNRDSIKGNNIHKNSANYLDENNDLQYAARYAFGYRVLDAKEGNDFGHQEKRNGKSAEGSYHVLLPDGRKQNVEYFADTSGYHAKVTYEHVAHHR